MSITNSFVLNLRADLKRYFIRASAKDALYLFFDQGLWAVVGYRIRNSIAKINLPIVSLILKFLSFIIFKMTEIVSGISIPSNVIIGPGFYIGHFGGIIINGRVVIGRNCSIGSGVVIGTKGFGDSGVPVIGNDVYIGVGAKIFGGITVGDNVRIGANSVVISNIPARSTVVGVPGRIVKTWA